VILFFYLLGSRVLLKFLAVDRRKHVVLRDRRTMNVKVFSVLTTAVGSFDYCLFCRLDPGSMAISSPKICLL